MTSLCGLQSVRFLFNSSTSGFPLQKMKKRVKLGSAGLDGTGWGRVPPLQIFFSNFSFSKRSLSKLKIVNF
jgi:hypothetical protein